MLMQPILPTGSGITIDLDQWMEALGGGGFAEALGSVGDSNHVLKRMHDEVPIENAIPKMLRLTGHAKVMGRRLDEILADSPRPLVSYVCRALQDTLTTHIGYSERDKHIYLYQRKAAGFSLRQLLSATEPLPWRRRVQIAKNFASAMFALSRCRVVHLDCSPDNVFVEMEDRSFRVTLIDLDGSGVLAPNDTWEIAPMTLGRPDEARPIWFPVDPEWQNPLAGYFKFAESWCVINEVWRILSWDRTALFWLDTTFNELFLGYERVVDMFRERSANLKRQGADLDPNDKRGLLASCYHDVGEQLQGLWKMALRVGLDPQDAALGPVPHRDQEFLIEFARLTLLAFLDPRNLLFVRADPELRGQMPNAKWIQDKIINLGIPSG